MTDNVKLDLYNAIEEKLLALPEFKHVLKYNSQDLTMEKEIPKQYPRMYIYYPDISWNPLMLTGHNQNTTQEQKGDITVAVRILLYSLKDNEDTFKPDFALIQKAHRSIIGMQDEGFTTLQRVSETDDIDNNNVRTWEIQYSTSVVECGVSKGEADAQGVTLDISGSFS